MTRDEAINALKSCGAGHWYIGATCDHCWVDEHRCTVQVSAGNLTRGTALLKRAAEIGKQAEATLQELSRLPR